jgi:D-sedoheptulose 7-phosphate isomerase
VTNSSSTSVKFADAVRGVVARAEYTGTYRPVTNHYRIIGNGGSAAIAIHICADLVKQGNEAFSLTDIGTFSALANDEKYKNVYAMQLKDFAGTLIAISSSGQSKNIIRAAQQVVANEGYVLTLTGFKPDNPLRQIGHRNIWVPSSNYGIVEIAHLTILHSLVNPGVY